MLRRSRSRELGSPPRERSPGAPSGRLHARDRSRAGPAPQYGERIEERRRGTILRSRLRSPIAARMLSQFAAWFVDGSRFHDAQPTDPAFASAKPGGSRSRDASPARLSSSSLGELLRSRDSRIVSSIAVARTRHRRRAGGEGSCRAATGACRGRRHRPASAASKRAAADEDARAARKRRCSSVVEQVVRPLDRRAQRLLAWVGVLAALEQIEPLAERSSSCRARRRRVRAAASSSASGRSSRRGHSSSDRRRRHEGRLEARARARNSATPSCSVERRHGPDAARPGAAAARGSSPARSGRGTRASRAIVGRDRRQQVLGVVEQHERRLPASRAVSARRALAGCSFDPERLSDGGERRAPDRAAGPAAPTRGRRGRRPTPRRRPAARAASSRCRPGPVRVTQPHVVARSSVDDVGELVLAARGTASPARAGSSDTELFSGGNSLVAELEHALGRGEILEPVLAEIVQRRRRLDERSRRRRDEHLAAVAGRRDPRRAMHFRADVALVGDERRPGVHADSHANRAAARVSP